MIERHWQDGNRDERLHWDVRENKKKDVIDKYEKLKPFLNERMERLWAASEAMAFGKGGVRAVSEALGKSRGTVIAGLRELKGEVTEAESDNSRCERQRRRGGGRKSTEEAHPEVIKAIEAIVDPATRSDPMTPLKWISKSLARIQNELKTQGYTVSKTTIGRILRETLRYGQQGLLKSKEGASHPDRDAQFMPLNEPCRIFQDGGQPVISVDTKKKELVGDFKNGGREWRPQSQPEPVRVHDFPDRELGKAAP